ncbi:MAG TPA: hypothetical protein PKA06_15260, partial [Gemmatales bacterium]|nr:hypothetical protein [Gemmatales bacterium]
LTSWDGYNAQPLPAAHDPRHSDRLALALMGSTQGETPAPLMAVPEKEKHRVHYLFLFEAVSVHLLVVLLGAAYLARAKQARRKKL